MGTGFFLHSVTELRHSSGIVSYLVGGGVCVCMLLEIQFVFRNDTLVESHNRFQVKITITKRYGQLPASVEGFHFQTIYHHFFEDVLYTLKL